MKKTTVYLPDDLKASLTQWASEYRQSESEFIREAIANEIRRRTPPRPRMGIFESGIPDLGSRVDELLAEGFGRD